MDELKNFLNSLEVAQQVALAESAGTSIGYIRKAISAGQHLSPATCVSIEQATGGQVRRWHLRPDDWFRIWPELIGVVGAPDIPVTA